MTEMNVIALTEEVGQVTPEELNRKQTLLGGKFGGTCYAAEGYATIRSQPEEKAFQRAERTAASGHHSVFQHGMVTMEVHCPKIIAMLLNSIGVSNTSEKSARYTAMQPETELELELYGKWQGIFVRKIEEHYGNRLNRRDVEKLAGENARYMISVFCATSMVYSLPFRNIFYVLDWAERMQENLRGMAGGFNKRLSKEIAGLIQSLSQVAGGRNFHDNKQEYFRFMPVQATGQYDDDNAEYYGDVYTAKFLSTFAQAAQEQRHRTTRVKINFGGDHPAEYGFYVPVPLRGTKWEKEWLADMEQVSSVYPQGILVSVTEQGLFEDFALKCKERMCGRAQLEIMQMTEELFKRFLAHKENLSKANRGRLEAMMENGSPCPRCGYRDFVCQEGCSWGKKEALTRLI